MDGVKSAIRVMEFLEYFARVRRKVSVSELARHYGYPNSSVSAVMRTLVARGYLAYEPRGRTYIPTVRMPLLTDWISAQLFEKDGVTAVMTELSEATGETVVLGTRSGLRAQYIQVIEATGPVRLHAEVGSFRRLTHSAIGLVLLASLDNNAVSRLVRRLNVDEQEPQAQAHLPDILEKMRAARRDGYVVSIGGVVPGGGAIAMALPNGTEGAPLAVGVASVEAVIVQKRDHFLQLMRNAIERHF